MRLLEKLTPEEGGLDTYIPLSLKNSTDTEILAACLFADCNKCGLNAGIYSCVNIYYNDMAKIVTNRKDEFYELD